LSTSQSLPRILTPVYVTCLIIAICLAIFYYPFTLDDAYITFHYSRALAQGYGVGAWNMSEPPVEGFSSLSWMLIIGVAQKVGFSPLVFSKAIGAFSYLMMSVLCITAYWCRKDTGTDPKGESFVFAVAAVISSLYLPLAFYSVSGMEVTFFSLQVMAVVLTPYLFINGGSRTFLTAIVSIILVLTRPEGILVAVLVNSYWLFSSLKKRVSTLWPLVGIGCALCAFGALTGYRVHHFGELVPNTYFAKATGGSPLHRLFLGLKYVYHFVLGVAPFCMVLGIGLVIARQKVFRSGLYVFLLIFLALYTLYVIKVGGDPITAFPLWRQFAHIAPVWIILLAAAICALVQDKEKAIVAALALVVVTDAAIVISHRNLLVETPYQFFSQRGVLRLDPPDKELVWLRRYSTAQTLSAISLAGQWPYVVPGTYIDILGLNDRHIAKYGHLQANSNFIDSKSDMQYVLSRKPDIIDGYVSGLRLLADQCPLVAHSDRSNMMAELIDNPEFRDHYVFITNAPYRGMDRSIFFRSEYAERYRNLGLKFMPAARTALYLPNCPTP
jgi:arabinofuranosyltransferase